MNLLSLNLNPWLFWPLVLLFGALMFAGRRNITLRFWAMWALTFVLHAGLDIHNVWSILHGLAWLIWFLAPAWFVVAGLVTRFNREGALWLGKIAFGMVLGFIIWDIIVRLLSSDVDFGWDLSWGGWPSDGWALFWLIVGIILLAIGILAKIGFLKVLGWIALLLALVTWLIVHWNDTPADNYDDWKPARPLIQVVSVEDRKVEFRVAKEDLPEGLEVKYRWWFGDEDDKVPGPEADDANPIHRYERPGTYEVKVERLVDGRSSLISEPLEITIGKPRVIVKRTGITPRELREAVREARREVYREFDLRQLRAGTGQIPDSPREAATESFTDTTVRDTASMERFLRSDRQLARDVRQRVAECLRNNGYPETEVRRALSSSDGWFWVAPKQASQIRGTTYPVDGSIYIEENSRGVAPHDATWFYLASDGNVMACASIRADCANPGSKDMTISPIPDGHKPPGIEESPEPDPAGGCRDNCEETPPDNGTPCTECPTKPSASQPVPSPAPGEHPVPSSAPESLPAEPSASTGNGGGHNPGSGGAPGGSTSDSGGTSTGPSSPSSTPTCNPDLGCGKEPSGTPPPPG